MRIFCFISKMSDFERISKYWKISKKECIAMFPQLALSETRQKRLDLMKNRVSFAI